MVNDRLSIFSANHDYREGYGAMVGAQSFTNGTACTAVRFRIPLGAGFSEKCHVSPFSILGHCFDDVSLGKARNLQMLRLTQVKK